MHKLIKPLYIMTVSVFLIGCASTRDVQVRGYVQDKERVDQELQGRVGNWQNAPMVTEDPDRKPTRKIYVVEFTKEPPTDVMTTSADLNELKQEPMEKSYQEPMPTKSSSSAMAPQRQITIPNFDDMESNSQQTKRPPAPSTAVSYVDYKVEKDDTLQKIAKKFYNSYSKWQPIYEANKEIIKDPNVIKPGLMLKIPVNR